MVKMLHILQGCCKDNNNIVIIWLKVAAVILITACKSPFSCFKESPFFPNIWPHSCPVIPSHCLRLWDSPGSLAAGKGQVGSQEDSTGEKETGSSPQAQCASRPLLARPGGTHQAGRFKAHRAVWKSKGKLPSRTRSSQPRALRTSVTGFGQEEG